MCDMLQMSLRDCLEAMCSLTSSHTGHKDIQVQNNNDETISIISEYYTALMLIEHKFQDYIVINKLLLPIITKRFFSFLVCFVLYLVSKANKISLIICCQRNELEA